MIEKANLYEEHAFLIKVDQSEYISLTWQLIGHRYSLTAVRGFVSADYLYYYYFEVLFLWK